MLISMMRGEPVLPAVLFEVDARADAQREGQEHGDR